MADHSRIFTAPILEDVRIRSYQGYVTARNVRAVNLVRDFFTSFRDIFGGRSASYQEVMEEMQRDAIQEVWDEARAAGGNAIIGFHMDFENIGSKGNSLLMVFAQGTAVVVEEEE